MMRVLVVGDHDVAVTPLRRALGAVAGVQLIAQDALADPSAVDAVVVEQSLDEPGGGSPLATLAGRFPNASLLFVALHRGDRYRWVHVRPLGAGFHVQDAGTDRLAAILAGSFAA